MTAITEAEARNSPCPFMVWRTHLDDPNLGQRHEQRRCMGSACKMAWRWAEGPVEEFIKLALDELPLGDGWKERYRDKDAGVVCWARDKVGARRGYCGAAGKP